MLENNEQTRSLVEGLNVLVAVNEMAPVNVDSLHEVIGLPEPALVQILETLVAEGYIVQRSQEEGGGYLSTPRVRLLASAFAQGSRLAQIAQPHLYNLSKIVKWPTEMLVRDGLFMLIEKCYRQPSPISLKKFEQRRFPILTTGSGRAYLAWLSKAKRREAIAASLATCTGAPPVPYEDPDKAERLFAEIRACGYTSRNYDKPMEGTRVFCVPALSQRRPIAILAIVTLRDVVSVEHFEAKILAPFQDAANDIARDFHSHSKKSTVDQPHR